MNSINGRYKLAAAALVFGVALAGCNAVEDVRSDPATDPPAQRVVLEGKVYGLGIRRSIGLKNGTSADSPARLVQGVLGEPVGTRGRETRFSFGSLNDGDSYNITITPELVPFGKTCVVNNGTGTVHYNGADQFKGAPQNIEVVCTNTPAPAVQRYDIRVATPDAFRLAEGAKVTLMTEEGVFEADPKDTADGDPNFVWFRGALTTLPASGVLPFQNIVKAYTTTGSTASLKLVNRCAVANHTFPSPAGTGADVTNISVGSCDFQVGGTDAASGGAVRYSLPIGVTTDPAMGAGGLVLELRYPNGNPVLTSTGQPTEVTITGFGGSFTFPTRVTSGAECPVVKQGEAPIPCEVRGFYEVVVKRNPDGQRCIAASTTVGLTGPLLPGNPVVAIANTNNANTNWAGAANLYLLDESVATGTFPTSPTDYTGVRVYCRNIPATGRVLTGSYQVTNMTTLTSVSGVETVTGTLPWSPAYQARRLYSHVLTFFPDGTFLFGAHTAGDTVNTTGVANHAEQGFYDYVNVAATDANNAVTGNKIRFTVHVDGNTGVVVAELPAGLSSAEGPRTVGTGAAGVAHRVLANVVIGTGSPRTIQGTFGPDGSPATTAWRKMVFTEHRSINGQMTGNWISKDYQRFWSYDFDSTVGFHAGVKGFPNIQDTCFQIEDPTASSGVYVPSAGGSAVYCSPVGSAFQSNLSSLAHSPPPLLQARLPGWEGWMPGSELGGGSTTRSPSPVHFVIAPAGTFAATANPAIFPATTIGDPTTWCATEVLGVRGTQNGVLVSTKQPQYFCRYRAQ